MESQHISIKQNTLVFDNIIISNRFELNAFIRMYHTAEKIKDIGEQAHLTAVDLDICLNCQEVHDALDNGFNFSGEELVEIARLSPDAPSLSAPARKTGRSR